MESASRVELTKLRDSTSDYTGVPETSNVSKAVSYMWNVDTSSFSLVLGRWHRARGRGLTRWLP